MTPPVQAPLGLPHAVFLQRLAAADEQSAPDARHGRAAFLALRLVDVLGPDHATLHPDAFHYQHVATERCCRDLPPPAGDTETSHLLGLVQAAADAFAQRDPTPVLPALLAYAHYLEDAMRLDEALDVLHTLLDVGGAAVSAPDRVAAALRIARVLRKLNRFDAAERSYEDAGGLARANGDAHSELLSRLGRADTLRGRGNLAEAERSLDGILADAEAIGYRHAQALAHHVLAAVLQTGGRPADAISHAWVAFQSYEDEITQGRALGDLGSLFLIVGETEGAQGALREAARRGGAQDYATNALIELMNCASSCRDRVGFERWREECEARRDSMPPNILVDFMLKVGIGRARFGQFDRAETLLASALQIAETAGLHEFVFRIERIKKGLPDCQHALATGSEVVETSELASDAVREVSALVARLES